MFSLYELCLIMLEYLANIPCAEEQWKLLTKGNTVHSVKNLPDQPSFRGYADRAKKALTAASFMSRVPSQFVFPDKVMKMYTSSVNFWLDPGSFDPRYLDAGT